MSCTCRLTPWRLFFRSLAQVHRLDVKSVPPVLGSTHTITKVTAKGRLFSVPRHHGFHASATSRQQEGTSLASKSEVSDAPEAPVSSSDLASEDSRGEPSGARPIAPESETQNPETAASSEKPKPARLKIPKSTITSPEETSAEKRPPQAEPWKAQKQALDKKFPDGWQPRKRLSPDALDGIRALNAQFPDVYTTSALAEKFEVSPEAIRRILKSKWRPSPQEEEERQQRWFRRGKEVWERKAALGIKPPKKWRREGIVRDPSYYEWRERARQRERSIEDEEIREYREKRPWDKNKGIF
ncbi:hypothetical protein HIM_00352 [Hirsutella minnesotensis 3608]|nr:hypothetical protein HIM_00352 [Hirsutella minnesotensis 3608]